LVVELVAADLLTFLEIDPAAAADGARPACDDSRAPRVR
jgi:hypothetical protein